MTHSLSVYLNSITQKSNFIDGLIYFIANPFGVGLFLLLCFYIFFIKKNIREFFVLIIIAVVAILASEFLKYIFGLPRPFVINESINPLFILGGNDSFPSGHATFFAALATFVYFRYRPFFWVFCISAILISLSRVISGVHHMEDVLFGLILGSILTILINYLFKLRNK